MKQKENKNRTEFGKGLVVCLAKFAQHLNNEQRLDLSFYKMYIDFKPRTRKMLLSLKPPDKFNFGPDKQKKMRFFVEKANAIYKGNLEKALSSEIFMFMNGASDHLYDIEVPESKDWNKIRTKVKELQHLGLQMGHGFNVRKTWTLQDVIRVERLVENICMSIDRKLGLKPDIGNYD